jgi:hypothetical protein
VGRQDRWGLAGGIYVGRRLSQERTTVEVLQDVQGSRWLERYSAPFCCYSADQVGPVSLLKAAEGCMALADQYCMVDSYQTLDPYVDYFGTFHMLLYCRFSEPVFDSELVNAQPHPVTPSLSNRHSIRFPQVI